MSQPGYSAPGGFRCAGVERIGEVQGAVPPVGFESLFLGFEIGLTRAADGIRVEQAASAQLGENVAWIAARPAFDEQPAVAVTQGQARSGRAVRRTSAAPPR